MIIYNPVPSPIDKIKNRYRWRIVVKCSYIEKVNRAIKLSIESYQSKKNTNIRTIVDVNPSNMM